MLKSGLPLATALDILSWSPEAEIEAAADRLCRDLMTGSSFSRALRNQPQSFPTDYCHIIRNGEESGQLVACLDRLNESLEQRTRLTQMVKSALIYPACLLSASMAMMLLLVFSVLPMLLKVTGQAGVEPPALTLFLMGLSSPKTLVGSGVLFALGATLVLLGLKHPKAGPFMREFWEEYTPVGQFQTRSRLIICLRSLALSLEVGIDALRSLRLTQDIAQGNFLLEKAFREIGKNLRDGKALSYGFSQHPVFPPLVSALVEVAEEAGNLDKVLVQLSDRFEEELETRVQMLSSLLEPFLLGAMGLVVAVVLLGAFLPVYNLVAI